MDEENTKNIEYFKTRSSFYIKKPERRSTSSVFFKSARSGFQISSERSNITPQFKFKSLFGDNEDEEMNECLVRILIKIKNFITN